MFSYPVLSAVISVTTGVFVGFYSHNIIRSKQEEHDTFALEVSGMLLPQVLAVITTIAIAQSINHLFPNATTFKITDNRGRVYIVNEYNSFGNISFKCKK